MYSKFSVCFLPFYVNVLLIDNVGSRSASQNKPKVPGIFQCDITDMIHLFSVTDALASVVHIAL